MGKVVMYSTVSVDGFIADEHDQPGPLFDWLSSGDVPLDGDGLAIDINGSAPLALGNRFVADRDLLLGHQLGQRAREGVDLMRVQFRPVAQLRRFVGQQALQQAGLPGPIAPRRVGGRQAEQRRALRRAPRARAPWRRRGP